MVAQQANGVFHHYGQAGQGGVVPRVRFTAYGGFIKVAMVARLGILTTYGHVVFDKQPQQGMLLIGLIHLVQLVSIINQLVTPGSQSAGLLVAGISLMVFSGLRFAHEAHTLGLPIGCLNQGRTRANELYTVNIDTAVGPGLEQLVEQLGA